MGSREVYLKMAGIKGYLEIWRTGRIQNEFDKKCLIKESTLGLLSPGKDLILFAQNEDNSVNSEL